MFIRSKVIKKLGKIILWLFCILLVLIFAVSAAVQNYRTQTWMAQRAAGWLSDKLHTRVEVGSVRLDFLRHLVIEGVYVEDLHQDTLLYVGRLSVNMDYFDPGLQRAHINEVQVDDGKLSVVYYRHDTDLNFQFIKDAFRKKKNAVKDTTPDWTVKFGDIFLNKFDFIYRDERDTVQSRGMDFEDLHVSRIDAHLYGFDVEEDTISSEIKDLYAEERSGFILRKLTGMAHVSPVSMRLDKMVMQTNASDIRTDLRFDYEHWDDYNHFVHKVKMHAVFDRSELQLRDLGYFAPELKGFDQKVFLSGEVNGKVDGLKGKGIDVVFGHDTHFAGDFSFKGLPDIDETFMTINIRELTTTKKELEQIPVPPYDTTNYLKLSPNMALLGKVRYKGKLTGYYYDLVSDGVFNTALGVIGTNIRLNQNTGNGQISYSGKLWSKDFDVGRLIYAEKVLGRVTLHADVDGSGVKLATLRANLKKCDIDNIEFNGYNYRNIIATGFLAKKIFTGNAKIKDENIDLTFDGSIDMTKSPQNIHFTTQVAQADLVALHFVKSDKHITIATTAEVNVNGNNLDDFIGNVTLTNSAYIQDMDIYSIDTLDISARKSEGEGRVLEMHSDIADAVIKGKVVFADLAPALRQVMEHYIPSLANRKDGTRKPVTKGVDENIQYDITLKNFDPVTALFIPSLKVAPHTHIFGTIDAKTNEFSINGSSSKIVYAGTQFIDWRIESTKSGDKFRFSTGCKRYIIADTIGADNPVILTETFNDSLRFAMAWKNNTRRQNYGNLKGIVNFTDYPKVEFKFLPSEVMVNDSLWKVSADNKVLFDSSSTWVKDLAFNSGKQQLRIDGKISENKNERMYITLNDFNIANFNVLTVPQGFTLAGKINGNGDFANLYDPSNLTFSSNFDFSGIYINGEEIGNGAVVSKYDKKKDAISVNGSFKRGELPFIDVNGFYYPSRPTENMDLDFEVNKFKMDLFQPFIADICSPLRGNMSAKVKITGEPTAPKVNGSAYVEVDTVRLNYLNTYYHFRGPVTIESNSFGVENLPVSDVNNRILTATGHVYHDNFRNFQLDFDMKADKFNVLNTTLYDNSLFYGKAFVSGIVNIFGYTDNIQIDAAVKTEKVSVPGKGIEYTKFFLPLSGPSEASENSFITFVKKDSLKKDDEYKMDLNGLTLNLQLEATPDAEAQIIFDEKVGDVIRAKGNGNLLMSINTNGNFKMYGEYEITDGDYLFTLQNLINKKFQIEQGGTIKWSGDPYNAEVNMNAVYVAKAALKPFFPEDSTQVYKKRVRAECVMNLSGALMSPDINFDINLPTVDANTSQTVKSYITTQQEMNQQIFTLLVLNSFTTPEALKGQGGAEGFSGGQAAGVTSSELLSNQLSNWLSQISHNFDLGVNYRPGDNLSRDEVELLMSKNFFNDRLTIDGTVGNNTNVTTQNTSAVVGDVNIDYKLSDDGKVRVKAYNKTNDNLILNPDAQYKQGVGIFYREEFDTVGELYRRYLMLMKLKKKEEPKS